MATKNVIKNQKKVSISTSSADNKNVSVKNDTDLSQKKSSNVGKGPSGENL